MTGSWMIIGEGVNDDVEGGFLHFFVVTLIQNFALFEGVDAHKPPIGSLKERHH